MMNKKKQRGAAAIEYAILAAAMSIVMFQFLGEGGTLTDALTGAYENVATQLQSLQTKS
ncbi:MAG: Flp family type IVb pilin [Moritella sp.]|uniref:Flp family type IVb pilin n=1 Tax=Moritella sp. TaxID=78556 RepID=UPI0025D4BFB2|nr:Flp family type IVb pilin [Moritella sp.]NQZ90852.1 Flp family type IVb pilin [Moritella sp.]